MYQVSRERYHRNFVVNSEKSKAEAKEINEEWVKNVGDFQETLVQKFQALTNQITLAVLPQATDHQPAAGQANGKAEVKKGEPTESNPESMFNELPQFKARADNENVCSICNRSLGEHHTLVISEDLKKNTVEKWNTKCENLEDLIKGYETKIKQKKSVSMIACMSNKKS